VKFEFLLVADAANLADGKVNALGLGWRTINFTQLPSPWSFSIVANVSASWEDAGTYEGGFSMVQPDGTEETLIRTPVVVESTPKGTIASVIMGLDVVSRIFTQEGLYTIHAKVGPVAAEYSFTVRTATAGSAPIAQANQTARTTRRKQTTAAR
jgi:hypothetical protein